ncbi:MAG: GIY-YIG nuclease family protein [Alphaproteobacteria bacterium]|nr:GIY-YIG nuclease family protein [Alphaproteobacteria bacterium]
MMMDEIPGRPGAYLLTIALDRPLVIDTARLRGTLPAGTYCYAGSARGPGGMRARIARHLNSEKRPHWHIDRLTVAGRVTGTTFTENTGECELAQAIAARADATVPLDGFGSSDCRRCRAHLVRIPGTVLPVSIAASITAIIEAATVRYLAVPPAAVPPGALYSACYE